jgi:hypothetical protein
MWALADEHAQKFGVGLPYAVIAVLGAAYRFSRIIMLIWSLTFSKR